MTSDKSFRVLLDLTDLRIDGMKFVWINVSPQELLTIADFKSSILRKINLESTNIKLYVRQGLLLDSETTTILREDDTIKVHYASQFVSEENTTEKTVKENRKSSRKRVHAECIAESSVNDNIISNNTEILQNSINEKEISVKHKKKKSKQLHSVEPENSCTQSIALETTNLQQLETHKKKDKKLKTSQKNQTDPQNCEFFSFNNSECTVVGNKEKPSQNTSLEISDISKTNVSKDISSINNVSLEVENQSSLKTVSFEDSNALNITSSKKRRKRRKRKRVNGTTLEITENTANNGSEFKSLVCEADKRFQGKHVKYTSSASEEEAIDIDCDDSFKDIKTPKADTYVLNGSLSNFTASNCSAESSYNHPKISTPAQSNELESPKWSLSGMQNTTVNSPVKIYKKDVELTRTNSISNNTWNSNKRSFSMQSEEKLSFNNYSDLPPLNARPDVGTHIAYKILELDEHYSPVISDYREGIVKSVNFENEEMEIELLKHVIKPAKTGKFENLSEGEIPLPEIKKYDTVKWSSLVEPKVLTG